MENMELVKLSPDKIAVCYFLISPQTDKQDTHTHTHTKLNTVLTLMATETTLELHTR